MNDSVKFPAYLTGFSSRSDGSAGVRFATQELKPEDYASLQQNLNQFGWLVFQANEAQPTDIPKEEAEDKSKTPSKRLRASLFVLWKQEGEQGEFESWYRDRMEKLIKYIQDKLD